MSSNGDGPSRHVANEPDMPPPRTAGGSPHGSTRSATAPRVTVRSVMHQGMISIHPRCTLADAAAEMAHSRVHCLIIDNPGQDATTKERLAWTVLTDVDLMRAVAVGGLNVLAGDLALSELVTVDPNDTVEHAAQLMGEHEVTHLVVVERASGQPSGVVSSLDIAGLLARS